MGFSNQFTWSKSRAASFAECERKYFLHYYEYWNGWLASAPETARRLYKLRSLFTVPSWVGDTVHQSLKAVFECVRANGEAPDFEEILETSAKNIMAQWEYSVAGKYWSEKKARNKSWFGLLEHELKIPVSEATPHFVFADVAHALANVYRSDLFDEARNIAPANFTHVDERSFFYLDGVKIWAVPDLMYTRNDGSVRIIDWKTGQPRPEDDQMQLAAYAAYAHLEHEVPLDKITTTLAFTRGARLETIDADADMKRIKEFARFAQTSMQRMTDKLVDQGEVEATRKVNQPLPIIQYPKTSDTYKCSRCNFRDECHPEGLTVLSHA